MRVASNNSSFAGLEIAPDDGLERIVPSDIHQEDKHRDRRSNCENDSKEKIPAAVQRSTPSRKRKFYNLNWRMWFEYIGHRKWIIIALFCLAAALAMGLGLGLVLRRRYPSAAYTK